MCVNNYNQSVFGGTDCNNSVFLCNKNAFAVPGLNGRGLDSDEPDSTSCMEVIGWIDEENSAWYYWTCETSGALTMDITPVNPSDDIDFMIYQLSGSDPCGNRSVIRCNSSSCMGPNGTTGLDLTDLSISEDPGCDPGENGYCQYINMVAGTSYALYLNSWSMYYGYNISFGGTGTFSGAHPNISSSALTICSGQSVTFNGSSSTNTGGGLFWNFSDGGLPVNASGSGPHTITYNNAGFYTAILIGTDTLGCQSTETVNIAVAVSPTEPIINNSTYCLGQTANPLVATGTNLLWYTNSTGGIGSSVAPIPTTSSVGTYSYYVTQTPLGCESPRAQINVEVLPLPDISVTSPVNLNCFPPNIQLTASSTASNPAYLWTGPGVVSGASTATPTVNGAGLYTVTITSGQCSNTSTVTVNPPTGSPQLSLSSSDDTLNCIITSINLNSSSITPNVSFQWTGPNFGNIISNTSSANVNTPGTYTITATDNNNGCTSVNSLHIAIDTASPVISSIPSQTLNCAVTSVPISASYTNGINYSWMGPNSGNPAGTTPTANSTVVNLPGSYTLTATKSYTGCANTVTVSVSIDTVHPSVTMGNHQNITCAVNTVMISGSGISNTGNSITYLWTGPSNGTPAGNTPASPSTNVGSAGNYTLSVKDQGNNCVTTGTLTVTASTDLPVITANATDTISCNTTVVTLISSSSANAVHYLWTGPTSLDTLGTNANAIAYIAGTYTLMVTDTTNNCTSSIQTQVLSDLASPSITLGPSLLLSCAVTSVPLTATTNAINPSYLWTGPSSGIAAGTAPTNGTTYVSSAGIYTVTVTNLTNACVSNATVQVNSNGTQTIVNAGPPSITLPCGGSINLNATQQQSGYSYNWTDTTGALVHTGAGPFQVHTSGMYYLNATNPATGCPNKDSIKVLDGVHPHANFSPSTNSDYLPLAVVYSNTSSGANNYQWFVSGTNGLPVSYSLSYANTFTSPGTYTVMLIASNGNNSCNDTAYTTIEVKERTEVIIPNIFSPNNDNINDVFMPIVKGTKELTIDIYDRWGIKVISFDAMKNTWDGKNCNEGTYFYIATGEGESGTAIEKKGFVMLVR